MGDVSKLPKWAQDQMASMQMRVRQLEVERDQILAGGGDRFNHGLWFSSALQDSPDVPAAILGKQLEWRGSEGTIIISQEIAKPSGKTWLCLHGVHGDGLQVRPRVSNSVMVRCVDNNEG